MYRDTQFYGAAGGAEEGFNLLLLTSISTPDRGVM